MDEDAREKIHILGRHQQNIEESVCAAVRIVKKPPMKVKTFLHSWKVEDKPNWLHIDYARPLNSKMYLAAWLTLTRNGKCLDAFIVNCSPREIRESTSDRVVTGRSSQQSSSKNFVKSRNQAFALRRAWKALEIKLPRLRLRQ
ncbi:unnamed protein product [Cylicostephanus goldi]|uniref:Uncharacterized protein n=1 Tax=Cylicostephanus goldi TaxID=71465 RepID=A0A3P7MNU1_CYLGO|nr:unnamed protein product [Cylicostephanus goldi]